MMQRYGCNVVSDEVIALELSNWSFGHAPRHHRLGPRSARFEKKLVHLLPGGHIISHDVVLSAAEYQGAITIPLLRT